LAKIIIRKGRIIKHTHAHTHTHKNHHPRPHNKKKKRKCEIVFLYVTKKKEMVVDEGISYRRRAIEKKPKKETSNLQRRRGTHTRTEHTNAPAPHVRTREAKHTTFSFLFFHV
jgi:hypothetical protein